MAFGDILHVEDDNNWIENVEKALKKHDINYVISAKSLSEARLVFGDLLQKEHIPKLIILDLSLVLEDQNDKGGLEFAKDLIQFGFTDRTSIIILSENINMDDAVSLFRECQSALVDIFRKSKFLDEIDRFIEKVQECLDKPDFNFN